MDSMRTPQLLLMAKIKVSVHDEEALSRWPCNASEQVLAESVVWPVGYSISLIAEKAFCTAFARPAQCCPLTILV